MEKILYALLFVDERQVRLGCATHIAAVVERLNTVCMSVDLDASLIARVAHAEVRPLLSNALSLSEAEVQQIDDQGEGRLRGQRLAGNQGCATQAQGSASTRGDGARADSSTDEVEIAG